MRNKVLAPVLADRFAEGEQKGRLEGKRLGESALLLRQLQQRFGPIPDSTRKRIDSADEDQLTRWGLELLAATSLHEIFPDPQK